MNEAALTAVQKINPHYKLVLRNGHKAKKYVNHCEKCGALQVEPNSGNIHVFKPELVEQAEQITLHYHNEFFECRSGHQSMLRCHGGYNAFDHMKHSWEVG